MIEQIRHLVRRTIESLGSQDPSESDERWASSYLSDAELVLWRRLHPRDRRHAIGVARRFTAACVDAPDSAIAGSLLHDIGKVDCNPSIVVRILATLIGPRTALLRCYREHETHGQDLLRACGSDPLTVDTACGLGPYGQALRRADQL